MMSKDTDEIKLIKKAIRGNSTAYGYLIEKHTVPICTKWLFYIQKMNRML